MDKITKAFINLIASEVCGQELLPELYTALNQEEAVSLFGLSKEHDLTQIVANALIKNGLLPEGKLKNGYNKELLKAVFRYEQSAFDLDAVKKVFDEEKILNIPLKGAVIRDFYPQPWMRTSCDIDIMVREEDLDRAIIALKEKLGYTCEREEKGFHDVQLFSPSGGTVELHYSLIENDVLPSINETLATVWERAEREENSYTLKLPDELFYYYHIAHMVKHFIEGGCGVKPFLDLWLLNNEKILCFDKEKRESLLNNGLLKFYLEVSFLTKVWFGNEEHTQTSLKIERFIIEGGVYGTIQNKVALQQVKKGGKGKYILSRIWLPYDRLKFQYPILERRKWLYPFYQVRRWCNLLFNGKGKQSAKELSMNGSVTKETQTQMEEMLIDLGLKE